ncbi:MAG: maleylpyruvate isomerase family mycothiol-dependent enzyme [Micropruina sp.]|uniref:maleylpyruvate isomerase family mycothiol-dependent enzyme n=1 Tax=Micropruina sp. TaxID=2737536 RepID=UPI0039E3B3EA
MPNTLDFAELGEGIGDAAAVLRNNAAAAGLDAPVPTCPGWTVRDLVTHQGLVHRWATATVRGEPARPDADVAAEAASAVDLLEWLDDGLVDLLNALASAPADLDVPFFLPDAPPPRQAWTRRQCHETTVHAIDAMAAKLGRAPRASELWVSPALARDGIDELLLGFAPRDKYSPRAAQPCDIAVTTADGIGAWTVTLGPDACTARVGASDTATARITGTARGIYAALWNRGGDWTVSGDTALVQSFRDQLRVTW